MVLSSLLANLPGAPLGVEERMAQISIEQSKPVTMTTYGWSDFPLVYEYNPDHAFRASSSTSSPCCRRQETKQAVGISIKNNTAASLTRRFSSFCSDASTDTSISTTSSQYSRRVCFAPTVKVREYAVTLGDHPCCGDALPLTLDWNIEHADMQCLDDYDDDEYSVVAKRPHRSRSQLRMTLYERKNILRSAGYSEEELQQAQGQQLPLSTLRHVPTITKFPISP